MNLRSSREQACYHCGQPVPDGVSFYTKIDSVRVPMCCMGCKAVAEAIVSNGLADYYRKRDTLPDAPAEVVPESFAALGLFDHPDFQKTFVRPIDTNEREADLMLEGITCAACVWLNERHLVQQPGVTGVDLNYTTRRVRVRWDERQTHLSTLLKAVEEIGYRAFPYDTSRSEQLAQKERRQALWRLLVAGLGMMQVMMYAVPAYIANEGEMPADIALLMRWASLLLTVPVVFYSAAPFFKHAWRDIGMRRLGMDCPVALGVGSAFLASVWATLSASGEVYFDSVTMFVFFLLCGRYLEMLARQSAVRGAESIAKLVPIFVEKLDLTMSTCERVPVSQLAPGDHVRVKPGETIPIDGVIFTGESDVNEACLSGESHPLAKREGERVQAGSINISNPLIVVAQQVGDSTRIAAINRLIQRASQAKPRIVEQAAQVASGFVIALILLAIATGIAWWMIDPARALWVFVSVLVVSCPCALSLATPIALTVATESFTKLGLLITRAHAIETFARIEHVVFDKTGTLSDGRMRVGAVHCGSGVSEAQALVWAAALEMHSAHPIANALTMAAQEYAVPVAGNVTAMVGQGMEGDIGGRTYRVGRSQYVAHLVGLNCPADWLERGGTQIALGRVGQWLAAFEVQDQLRAQAKELVAAYQDRGLHVSLFSGDAAEPVRAVADVLKIHDARAAMSPEDKHAAVQALQQRGAVVAMIGDGVNDAPVLAQAQLSIALAGGADLARNQADIVLLNDDLNNLIVGRALAEKSLHIIRQNLGWAAFYNLCAIPAAVLGWVTPWMAGLGMSLSSLIVVLNALRLRRDKAYKHKLTASPGFAK